MPPDVAADFWRDRREHVAKIRREACGVSRRVLDGEWSFDTYGPRTDSERKAATAVREWVMSASRRWLMLTGDVGVGKSILAQCAIYDSLPFVRAQYVTRIDLVADIMAGFQRENMTEADCVEHWVTVPRLAIDDVDKGRVSEYVLKTLWSVIDGRIRADRETILTANGTLDALYEYLAIPGCEIVAQSIVDRLRGACTVINVRGASKRGVKG